MATWDATFHTKPDGDDKPSTLDNEQRNHRGAVEERMKNEHDTYTAADTDGSAAADWRHREGSARAYYQSAEPTNQPGTAGAALGASDNGRLWIDSDTGNLQHWDGDSFEDIGHVGASFPLNLPVLHVREEQVAGMDGGTFTSGDWRKRTLNTEVTNTITGASLATSQITLPAGTYKITARAPAFAVVRHNARLYNTSDASTEALGSSSQANSGGLVQTDSSIIANFTIAGEKVFELQHQCQSTRVANGLGFRGGFQTEIYTDVYIEQLA